MNTQQIRKFGAEQWRPFTSVLKWLMVVVWVGAGLVLVLNVSTPRQEIGEAEKVGSGRSQAGQITIESSPRLSGLRNGFDAERVWSEYDDWEPAIAVDPGSDTVYQLTTRYSGPAACGNCGLPAMVFRRSADGGATWEPDQFLAETRKTQNDPMIEVATDGTIYVAWLNQYRPGVVFQKSADTGETWSEPLYFTELFRRPRWSDRPVLAISADGQHVYIAFNASDSYVVASHDYGETFSRPVQTNQDERYWFHSAGAVAPNGDVYFGTVDYSQDYLGDSFIGVIRSTDGGATWTTTNLDRSAEMPYCDWAAGCYFGFLGPSIGLAVDRAGTVLVAYYAGDGANEPQRMFVRRSADGVNWGARRPLSSEQLEHNAFPALAAGPQAGDFRVVWQGSFDGRTDVWNTWYRRTTDGGETWDRAARLSDLDSGTSYRHEDGFIFPYGDYLEIAVDSDGRNHVIWGEGLSYIGPGGTWYTRSR